ncbi:MAG: DnaJ domain-containing protein [Phycisphaerales bacterium]|nr:DnaJ domain-containing protein [Phycisphaerales bacterium]
MKYQDYYQILGVDRTASADEIQRAYRKLARQYHPDVNKEKGAEARFKEIGEAYEVLKDTEKRKLYDQLGSNWKAGQEFRPPAGWSGTGGHRTRAGGSRTTSSSRGGSTGFDFDSAGFGGFSDFFESVFGGGDDFGGRVGGQGGRTRTRAHRGGDEEARITIPLIDAIRGASKRLSLHTGGPETGSANGGRTYEVKIPAGTTDGGTIRLAGKGGAGFNGGEPGDLFLRVHIEPDPRFRIDGHDLTTTVNLAPWEAALGAKVPVQTPEGEVTLTIPAGSQSGSKLRLRGRGFPRRGGEPGDLYAELRVMVPRSLTDEERELYEKLRDVSVADVRRG